MLAICRVPSAMQSQSLIKAKGTTTSNQETEMMPGDLSDQSQNSNIEQSPESLLQTMHSSNMES